MPRVVHISSENPEIQKVPYKLMFSLTLLIQRRRLTIEKMCGVLTHFTELVLGSNPYVPHLCFFSWGTCPQIR